jgi:hypothetical protein
MCLSAEQARLKTTVLISIVSKGIINEMKSEYIARSYDQMSKYELHIIRTIVVPFTVTFF